MSDPAPEPKPATPPASGAAEELISEKPTNYDGQTPPGLPKPPGQEG